MKSITVNELAAWIHAGKNVQLIDVREAFEHDAFNIGGALIPFAEIIQHTGSIETERPVIFYCSKGIRSQIAIQRLLEKFPFKNLLNLTGGMEAWKAQFPI